MIDLNPACHRMIDMLKGVGDEQLEGRTPCAEYSVRELIAHVDEAAAAFAGMAGGSVVEGREGDWRVGVVERVRGLGEAWAEPGAWAGTSEGAGLELPNERWGLIALTEMVVHGWDLARATGQVFDLPEETLRACHAHVREFVLTAPIPEFWGPPVEVPEDAPLMDKVVAGTGRRP